VRGYRSQGMMVTVQGTSIRKVIITLILGVMMIFALTAVMTSLSPKYRLSSSSINNIADNITGQSLIYLLGYENHYFTQSLPETSKEPNFTALLFESMTSINTDDPRSLLGRELPGFSIFDAKIVVAGEGTNYTNMPIESAPPLEVLLAEREASLENIEGEDSKSSDKPVTPPAQTTGDKKVVYIYHTHNRESYFPHLKGVDTSNANNAFHPEVNVTLVGKKLGEELEARGLGAEVDTTDVTTVLHKKDWQYTQSYRASRDIVATAMKDNRDINYLIDIHRDAARHDVTTATVDGKKYAKVAFIVGSESSQYEKNIKIAEELHKNLDKKYPGLSRGVFEQGGPGNNGVYNQDLSGNAMLIEFGGVDNSMEELNRTAAAIAEVVAEHYWQAEKVNGSSDGDKAKE